MKKTLILLFLAGLSAQAQIINTESLRMVTDTTGWTGSVGLNVGFSKNVKELFKIKNHVHIQYKTHKHLVLFMNNISFEQADGADFVNKGVQHLRYNYRVKPRLNWEVFVQNQYNAISKIEFRRLLGSGPRYKFSISEKYKMYLGSLAMYEYEKTLGETAEYHKDWRSSSYFSFSFFFTPKAKLISTTYYQPKFADFSDYRVAHQSAFIMSIYKNLSFKTAFNLTYDVMPVAGIPNKDYSLTNGLVYKF
jgi:hypothetical protein